MGNKQTKQEIIVKLISLPQPSQRDVKKLIKLIKVKKSVSREVDGFALIHFYLNNCGQFNATILETFAHGGYDLNVQDKEGRTPMHHLVGRPFSDDYLTSVNCTKSKLIATFLANGANPCLLDTDGNNVLMLAVLTQQPESVVKELTSLGEEVTQRLVSQKNRLGFDVLTLYFRSRYIVGSLPFNGLIRLGPDVHALDMYGNNCLHNMFLKPVDSYKPTVEYSKSTISSATEEDRRPGMWSNLKYLLDLGADITHKNKRGLVPLQVALDCTESDKIVHLIKLKPLVPTEDVLKGMVPWSGGNKLILLLSHLPNAKFSLTV